MSARLESRQWVPLSGLAGVAAAIGVLAGANPTLAIAMALACAFVGIAFSNFTLALAIYCYDPAGIGVDESVIARVAVVVLVVAWVGLALSERWKREEMLSAFPAASRLVAVFLGWVLLSIAWAADPATALEAAGHFAAAIAVFAMTITAVRNMEQATTVCIVLVLGAVAAAIVSLATGDPEERLRSASTGANELAAVLIVAVAIAIGLALTARRSPALRLAYFGAAAFCLFATFMTASRGGLVSIGMMMLAAAVIGGPWRGRALLAGLVISSAAVFYFSALAPQADRERIEKSTDGQARFLEGRATIWTVAERMSEEHPLQGVGAGNFKVEARKHLLEPGALPDTREIVDEPKVAHSSYLEVLTGLGTIGLVLFLTILGSALLAATRAAQNFRIGGNYEGMALATAVAVAIVAVLTADLFLSQHAEKQVWGLLGMGPALLAISRQESVEGAAA